METEVADLTADALDGEDVVADVAGEVGRRVSVFAALAIEGRPHALDGLDGRRVGNHDHVVHAAERREPAGAQLVVEVRPARTLVDQTSLP